MPRRRHPIEERIAGAAASEPIVIGCYAPKAWDEKDNRALLRDVHVLRSGQPRFEGYAALCEDAAGNGLVERHGSIGAVPMDGLTTYHDLLFADGVLVATYYGHDYGHPLAYYVHGEAREEVAALVRSAALARGLELHDEPVKHRVPYDRAEPVGR